MSGIAERGESRGIYCNQTTLQDIPETLMVAAVTLAIAIDKSRRSR
jgi:hypothetical protein